MIKPIRGIVLNKTHPLSKDLHVAWLFNELSGSKFYDQALPNDLNNGSLSSANSWSTNGLEFSGAAQETYLVAADNDIFPLADGHFTIIMGIFPHANNVDDELFYASTNTREFRLTSIGGLRMYCGPSCQATSVAGYTSKGNSQVIAGRMGESGAQEGVDLFHNGKEVSYSVHTAGDAVNYASTTIYIGSRNADRYYDGKMEFIYIFHRALSDEEILSISTNPYQMFENPTPGLRTWAGHQIIPSNYTGIAKVAKKPVGAVMINPAHHLSRGMRAGWAFNSPGYTFGVQIPGQGQENNNKADVYDVTGNNHHLFVISTDAQNVWRSSEYGLIMEPENSSNYNCILSSRGRTGSNPVDLNLEGAPQITLVCMVRTPSWTWTNGDSRMIAKQTTYQTDGMHWHLGFYNSTTAGQQTLRSRLEIGGSVTNLIGNNDGGAGWYSDGSTPEWLVCATTYDGSYERLYICNLTAGMTRIEEIGNQQRVGAIGDDSEYPMYLGASNNLGSLSSYGEHGWSFAYVYDRALGEEELNQLIADPYQMFDRQSPARFFEAQDGNIVVVPTAGDSIVGTISPSTVLGSILASPDVLNAIANTLAPITILGSITEAPGFINAITDTVAPDVVLGSINILPDGSTSISVTSGPSLLFGSTIAEPSFGSALTSTVDPAVSFGSVTFTPALISAIAASEGPTVFEGQLIVTPDFAFAIAAKNDPDIILGSVLFAPAFSYALSQTADPVTILGSISIDPGVISAIAAGQDPTTILGDIVISPDGSFSVVSTLDPTTILGSIAFEPSVTTSILSTISPTTIQGSLVIQPDGTYVVASTVEPSVTLGSISLTPAGTEALASTTDPTIEYGSVIITAGSSISRALTLDPSILEGGNIIFIPTPSATIGATVAPAVLFGSVQVQPDGSFSIVSTSDPTTILGSLTLTDTAIAYTQTIDPQIILGALNLAPVDAGTIANTSIGDIELSSMIVTPNFSDAIAVSIDPTVLTGGILFSPAFADSISQTLGPTTILGSLELSPAVSDAIASTIDPTVFSAGDAFIIPAAITAIGSTQIEETVLGSLILGPDGTYAIAQTSDPTVMFSGLQENICIRGGDGLSLVTDGFLIPCSGDGSGPEVQVPVIIRVEGIEGKVNSEADIRASIRTPLLITGTLDKEKIIIGKKSSSNRIKVKIADKETIKGKVNE